MYTGIPLEPIGHRTTGGKYTSRDVPPSSCVNWFRTLPKRTPSQVYPSLLLVLLVFFMYAVISPFISVASIIFFALAYIVYKHQVKAARR